MQDQSYFLRIAIIGIIITSLVLIISVTVGIGAIFLNSRSLSPSSGQEQPIRIGIIQYAPVSNILTQGFKQGMEELGYTNIQYIETEPTLDQDLLAKNALDVVAQGVNLIFATTTVGGKAALNATSDIPIVWTHAAMAVSNGLATDYRSSGNNSTGIEISFPELTRKKVEFLTRIDPAIETIGILNPEAQDFATLATLPVVIEEAQQYGINLIEYPVESAVDTDALEEIQNIMASIQPNDFDAYIYIPSPSIAGQSLDAQIEMTKRLKVPSFWLTQDEVLKGGLFTYEYDNIAMGKQSARMAQKVLQGINPSNIPIEFPAKTSLIMNFQTIKDIGIVVPEDILQIVDTPIE